MKPQEQTAQTQAALHALTFGATGTKLMAAAAELGLPDLMAAGLRSSADLARRTSTHRRSLQRLLRALAGIGLVVQASDDEFELTELGSALRSDSPESQQAVVTMLWGTENWSAWGELVPSLRSGRPGWDRAHGRSWIEYYASHPDALATFNRAMAQHTRAAAPALLRAAHLTRFQTVVDVGGGDGMLLAEMLRAHEGMQGILVDLPPVLEAAATTLAAQGLTGRCRLEPGDFFNSVPAGGDAYVLKQILHDWPDDSAVDILQSCRVAMAPHARVLIMERLLPERAEPAAAPTLFLDMHMLVITGGRERTVPEFRDLLTTAGLTMTACSDRLPPFDYHVIEAAPAPPS
jgi:hypothetical protein